MRARCKGYYLRLRERRIELSTSRSGSAITDKRWIREAEESLRSARHMQGVLSPKKKQSSQAKLKCDHPYTTISGGRKICSTCGLQLEKGRRRVAEEGHEDRAIFKTKKTDLHSEIVSIFERLIHRLSHPSITAEKDLGWLLIEIKKYILPNDASVEKGKRKHPFRISARPEGLCTAVLWMRVRVLDLPMSMTEFSKRIGVSRPTMIGASKQLDGHKTILVRRPGRPRKAKPQTKRLSQSKQSEANRRRRSKLRHKVYESQSEESMKRYEN